MAKYTVRECSSCHQRRRDGSPAEFVWRRIDGHGLVCWACCDRIRAANSRWPAIHILEQAAVMVEAEAGNVYLDRDHPGLAEVLRGYAAAIRALPDPTPYLDLQAKATSSLAR